MADEPDDLPQDAPKEEEKDPNDGKPKATVFGTDWPGKPLKAMPGDFSKYVPRGMGLGMPAIVRPWDDPLKALSGPNYYGFEAENSDPIRGAPATDPGGGVIYFDDGVDGDKLLAALWVMHVRPDFKEFAVFGGQSQDSNKERYLDQVRIMSTYALKHLFGASEEEKLAAQPVTLGEFVLSFVADQKKKWNDGYGFSGRLSGSFGGDGDWAKESLCFGFLVENSYWGVYRLWSRAWLVTK